MATVTKVWIDEGCITCDACESICPEVFDVQDETCVIVDGVNPSEWGDDIIEAAEGCPVDVIMYETAAAEAASEADAAPEPAAEVAAAPAAPAAPAAEAAGADGLAGLLGGADRDLHILFGSQSGNAEGLAAKISKRAADFGLTGHVHDMDGFDLASLASMKRVLITCSTWGEGEQPDNAAALYETAKGAGSPLSSTHFAVCALGDTSYEFFCQSGKEWDDVLASMGGSRIHDRVDCDVDYDAPAAAWTEAVLARIACVDDAGSFQEDLVESMAAHGAGDAAAGGDMAVGSVALPEMAITVNLFRYDPATGESGVDTWACSVPGHASVLDLLRTVKADQDPSLTFRDGGASDPSTGISVNGRVVLPGMVRIAEVAGPRATLRIDPLPAYEVIRDLAVDLRSHEELRAATSPWMVGGERPAADTAQGVMGTMDAAVATALHAGADFASATAAHAMSDATPYNGAYFGPANLAQIFQRINDPRTSEKSRAAATELLAGDWGANAETDLASIQRQGATGAGLAMALTDAKNCALAANGFNGRHGKHAWWYTWTIKSSGRLNETMLYRQVLGPLGLASNALTGISARMIAGFTRSGGPMITDLLALAAPPAGVGKMPKQFNSRVENHHEVVAIFNEMDARF